MFSLFSTAQLCILGRLDCCIGSNGPGERHCDIVAACCHLKSSWFFWHVAADEFVSRQVVNDELLHLNRPVAVCAVGVSLCWQPPCPFEPDVADVCQLLNWKNMASKLLKLTLEVRIAPLPHRTGFHYTLQLITPKLCDTQTQLMAEHAWSTESAWMTSAGHGSLLRLIILKFCHADIACGIICTTFHATVNLMTRSWMPSLRVASDMIETLQKRERTPPIRHDC